MRSFKTASACFLVGISGVIMALAVDSTENKDAVVDRVGFPVDYQKTYQVVRAANKTKVNRLGTIYANSQAASIKETGQLPYPAGSIIVMEWAEPLKDEAGVVLTDTDGLWRKGKVTRIDVMRRETGYGEVYGEKHSGEWEFASYKPDGSHFESPALSVACAECHQKAGAERDFVFRGRFPPVGTN